MALFLGRAIVDEVLAPSFLTKVLQRLRDDSLGIQIVRSVGESPRLSPKLECWRALPWLHDAIHAPPLGNT